MDVSFQAFLNDVLRRAKVLEGETYISEDVRQVLRDFMVVSANFSSLQSEQTATGADVRILKKRYDQAKLDLRNLEKKLNEPRPDDQRVEWLKALAMSGIAPAKILNLECAAIEDHKRAARLKEQVQKIAEILVQMQKI